QGPPVELRLRHEAEPDLRPDRHPEWPRIEARDVVARKDESAGGGEVLLAANPQPIGPVQDGRAQHGDDVVDGRRPHFTKQYPGSWLSSPPVSKRLVIVESPAKARTIAGYLGPEFVVESSVGHIRDLPQRAADIPAEYKKEKWARLGVDVEDDFRPLY